MPTAPAVVELSALDDDHARHSSRTGADGRDRVSGAAAGHTPTAPPPPGPASVAACTDIRALKHPGFRIYFVGMLFRGASMWMPLVAIPWLAVELGATPRRGRHRDRLLLPAHALRRAHGRRAGRPRQPAQRDDRRADLRHRSSRWPCSCSSSGRPQTLPLLMAFSFGFGLLIAVEVPIRQAFMTELIPRVGPLQRDLAPRHGLEPDAPAGPGPGRRAHRQLRLGLAVPRLGPGLSAWWPSRSCGWTATAERVEDAPTVRTRS